MATSHTPAHSSATRKPAQTRAPAKSKTTTTRDHDPATALLMADHAKVKKLFKQFEKSKTKGTPAEKAQIVAQACLELRIHTRVEEEIFYPAVKAALGKDGDMIDEAVVEHASCKDLIAQLSVMKPGDELFDARFTVLSEFIEHHVEEEETELFPKVRKLKGLNLDELGEQMKELKQTLSADTAVASAH
ncbi:hemerythrin domain-containing protein [Silvimonas sp.]|uniref:hemerythrin domain-containing protein n=1 Tax=Silvimonas sp. TaxID=2650811 RepID=UPI002849C9D0|nr:hemerythrin domain-containing protein [Silvimonas sp.]MDR3427170.1 hemerythrin domain-containing protein [Silvimonas sp.]